MKKEFKAGQLVAYAPTDQNGLVYYHAGATASPTPVIHVYPIENCSYITIVDTFNSLD